MPISWNEIRQNAIRFSREWSEECREDAEAKSFWDEFFTVFGMRRRLLATFEEPVRKNNGQYGYIDLFWRGVMLAEHKSRGKRLDKAESQAFHYIQDLAHEGRTDDLPRYVILSDFERVALYDLEPDEQAELPLPDTLHYRKTEFPLKELHKHILSMNCSPPSPTSMAISSRSGWASPTSTARCAMPWWPARTSTGRAFPRRYSARSSRA